MSNSPVYAQPNSRAPEPSTRRPAARWTLVGAVLLSTLVSGLLASSLIGASLRAVGEPLPFVWRALLGSAVQTGVTSTVALLIGVLLLGFSLGGLWFLIVLGARLLRRRVI